MSASPSRMQPWMLGGRAASISGEGRRRGTRPRARPRAGASLSSATVRRRIRRVFKGHGPGDCGSVVSLTPLVLSKLSSGRTDGRMDGGAARVPPSSLPGASCSPHPGGNRRSGFVRSESVSRPRGGAQSPSHAREGAQAPLPACLPGRLFQE